MILVTLGTQDKSFLRLLSMLEECLHEIGNTQEVIVQAGYTSFQSETMQVFDYIDMQKYDELLAQCDILITHGGVGTIVTALKMGKKIIASPRLAEFGEHHNDHQREIIDSFCEKGYILACTNKEEMKRALQQIKQFQPKSFVSNQAKFLDLIRKEIGLIE